MAAYVILDVEIHDMARYQTYMAQARPAVEAAGGEYLVRGGPFTVYEGDWQPRRIVVLRFPSLADWEAFYGSEGYREMKELRHACSSSRLIGVVGMD